MISKLIFYYRFQQILKINQKEIPSESREFEYNSKEIKHFNLLKEITDEDDDHYCKLYRKANKQLNRYSDILPCI
jgi:hypothetical protein